MFDVLLKFRINCAKKNLIYTFKEWFIPKIGYPALLVSVFVSTSFLPQRNSHKIPHRKGITPTP